MDSGKLVRRYRLDRGLSQAELARRARTSQPAVARLEAGRLSPSVDTLERVLGALGMRLEITARETESGVDETLVAQALRLTPELRLRRLREAVGGIERLRRAMPGAARE